MEKMSSKKNWHLLVLAAIPLSWKKELKECMQIDNRELITEVIETQYWKDSWRHESCYTSWHTWRISFWCVTDRKIGTFVGFDCNHCNDDCVHNVFWSFEKYPDLGVPYPPWVLVRCWQFANLPPNGSLQPTLVI